MLFDLQKSYCHSSEAAVLGCSSLGQYSWSILSSGLCDYIYFDSTVAVCKNNICQFLAFLLKLLLPDATEDALQKGCGLQCTVGGLHSKVDPGGGFDIFIAGSV